MVAVAVAERVGLPVRQTAQHQQPIAERRERAENRREVEPGARRGRHPLLLNHTVRDVDEAEPARRAGGGLRQRRRGRNHGVEQRQGHRGAQPAQERPSGQHHFGDDHWAFLIWNGVLFTIPLTIDANR